MGPTLLNLFKKPNENITYINVRQKFQNRELQKQSEAQKQIKSQNLPNNNIQKNSINQQGKSIKLTNDTDNIEKNGPEVLNSNQNNQQNLKNQSQHIQIQKQNKNSLNLRNIYAIEQNVNHQQHHVQQFKVIQQNLSKQNDKRENEPKQQQIPLPEQIVIQKQKILQKMRNDKINKRKLQLNDLTSQIQKKQIQKSQLRLKKLQQENQNICTQNQKFQENIQVLKTKLNQLKSKQSKDNLIFSKIAKVSKISKQIKNIKKPQKDEIQNEILQICQYIQKHFQGYKQNDNEPLTSDLFILWDKLINNQKKLQYLKKKRDQLIDSNNQKLAKIYKNQTQLSSSGALLILNSSINNKDFKQKPFVNNTAKRNFTNKSDHQKQIQQKTKQLEKLKKISGKLKNKFQLLKNKRNQLYNSNIKLQGRSSVVMGSLVSSD